MADCFIGIDVGSSSVRATAIDITGKIVGSKIQPILINNPQIDFYEQSSEQIWQTCCLSVKHVLEECHLNCGRVKGVGFDATCSLVVLDEEGNPLSVSPTDTDNKSVWNIVMWMDHRAKQQTDLINETKHECLKSVGGNISLEMQPPKLLWLKEHKPETYFKAGHFMDLADFMTFKSTGSLTRSSCCVGCKWLYKITENTYEWNAPFYKVIGLEDLCEKNFEKIGSAVNKPGTPCGSGLTPRAAAELGLPVGTAVATGIIDAHAGCIGMLNTKLFNDDWAVADLPNSAKLSMICGTSACHMALSNRPLYVPGIWGPYFEAIWPGLWVNEAGQSLVGPVLDNVVKQYGYLLDPKENSDAGFDRLQRLLTKYETRHGRAQMACLTQDTHVWPDYHGNRSPLADPSMTGAILGLKLASDADGETRFMTIYMAHVQAMALMTRYITDTLVQQGHSFGAVYMCGGLQKNPYYVRAHADVLQLPVVIPDDSEPVARGAAILGAFSSGHFQSLEATAKSLSPDGTIVYPNSELKEYFERKYVIFRKLGDLMLDIKKC